MKNLFLLLFVALCAIVKAQTPEVTLTVTSSWGGGYSADVVISPQNNISSWEIKINMSGTISSSWSGVYTLAAGVLTITPDTWNSVVKAGNSITLGFTVNGSGTPTLQGFTLVKEVAGGSIFGYRAFESLNDKLYLSSSYNYLGVGTTSPLRTLDVMGNARIISEDKHIGAGIPPLFVANNSTGGYSYVAKFERGAAGGLSATTLSILMSDVGNTTTPSNDVVLDVSPNNAGIVFRTGQDNKKIMFLDPEGLVGIGTYKPQFKLDVDGQGRFRGKDGVFDSPGVTIESMGIAAIAFKPTNPDISELHYYQGNSSNLLAKTKVEKDLYGGARWSFIDEASGSSLDRLVIAGNGNVGVGVSAPTKKLHVVGEALFNTSDVTIFNTNPSDHANLNFRSVSGVSQLVFRNQSEKLEATIVVNRQSSTPTHASVFSFYSYDQYMQYREVMRIDHLGVVHASEIKVSLPVGGSFPDYVFSDKYKLMSLEELDCFIKEQHHLPNINTAEDVKTNGLTLGEMQIKQMEKIEELTLYIIELNKKVEAQQKVIESLTK